MGSKIGRVHQAGNYNIFWVMAGRTHSPKWQVDELTSVAKTTVHLKCIEFKEACVLHFGHSNAMEVYRSWCHSHLIDRKMAAERTVWTYPRLQQVNDRARTSPQVPWPRAGVLSATLCCICGALVEQSPSSLPLPLQEKSSLQGGNEKSYLRKSRGVEN